MKRQHRSVAGSQQSNHRGRRIACRPCRQAKIRCELSSGGTAPCTRCLRLEQDCEFDSDFKRVNKRARLQELEDEVRQLRSSVSNLPPSKGQKSHELLLTSQSLGRLVSNPATSIALDSTQPARFGHSPVSANQKPPSPSVPALSTAARCLGHLTFSPSQIDRHFQLFFCRYYIFVPLLDPSVAPDDYFQRSPLLFWVVIFTSARQYPEEPSLLTALTEPVKKLLWETIANPPHTWYIVQAISILCMWPFPTSSLSTDTTPMLVNIAQTIAMQLGLHQPESIQDFSRTKRRLSSAETSEVVRTWAVCYIASQSLFTTEGMPLTSSDCMVDRICDDGSVYEMPSILKQQLLIYRFSARLSNYMSKSFPRSSTSARTQESDSVLALMEEEFENLRESICDKLSVENDLLLSNTGLQLYVYYLLDSGDSLTRKIGLVKAFDMATDLIDKLHQLDNTSNFMKHCPVSYFRATSLAALFILRLEDSSFVGVLDEERGKRAFNTALSLLRRASLEDNDLPGRMSKILAQVWSIQGGSQGEEPRLRLRTRLGASLLHDTVWRWRENFGGQMSVSNTPPRAGPRSDQHTDTPSENCIAPATLNPCRDNNGLLFEDVFDPEMLSLFPFDFGDVSLDQGECR